LVVRRHRSENGAQFLGCPNWYDPKKRCDYTEEMPEEFAIRESGAPRLPGID
jgi:hypothetical protein